MADFNNSLRDELKQVMNNVQDALNDLDKFQSNGNHAAGVRVRSNMQLVKNGAQTLRIAVLEKINADKAAAKAK